jgi:hypothetical protein
MSRGAWTPVPAGDGRSFVYSPRFGRTYLLSADLVTSSMLPPLVGLRASSRRISLPDPTESIELVGTIENDLAIGWFLPRLYSFLHAHRTVVATGRAIRLIRCLARMRRIRPIWGPPKIGRTVMAVEQAVGYSDCYPRALLTAYLCQVAKLPCQVTVGILAPTANLHAWCSTQGVIPYEPINHHWWYSPLVVFDVT